MQVLPDTFITSRYAELVENPIMYSKPDYTTFNVDGMDILISVYSPTGKFTANPRNEDDDDCPKNIFRQNQCNKKIQYHCIYLLDC
jgi:hypothetical protein